MTSGGWLFAAAGGAVALVGLGLLGWALVGDRVRTRRPRRRGELRRCPRCWYDMTATGGLICPECGRDARRERRLGRSRRRWRWAAVGLAVVTVGAGTIAWRLVPTEVWPRLLPDSVVIELIPYSGRSDWAAKELSRRKFGGYPIPSVQTPGSFSAWERERLSVVCTEAVERWTWRGGTEAWGLLTYTAARPEVAFEAALRELGANDPTTRYYAHRYLMVVPDRLSTEQLAATIERFTALSASSPPGGSAIGNGRTIRLQALLDARTDEKFQESVRAAEAVELSPDQICEVLHKCTAEQVDVLCERLGLRRQSFSIGSSMPGEQDIEIWRRDLHIDSDAQIDCVLEVRHRVEGGGAFLVFRQAPTVWQFLGCIDAPSWSDVAADLESVTAEDGQRWLRMSSSFAHMYTSIDISDRFDAWYRYSGGRLRLVQWVATKAEHFDILDHSLHAGPPTIERQGRRHFVSYEITTSVSMPRLRDDEGEDSTIGRESGRFSFPIDPASLAARRPSRPMARPSEDFGLHHGDGPWEGRRYDWLLEYPDEVLVERFLPELLARAERGDEYSRDQLRLITVGLPQTEAVIGLDRALADQ